MTPLVSIEGIAAPLMRDNVDTDAIIPSREMKTVSKSGLADGLFAGWRYTAIDSRDPDPSFILNDPQFSEAQILISGANFGCGSSREHAVWALAEYGFRVVIAPSFSPIFQANCIRNGIAPVILSEDATDRLAAGAGRGERVEVDLRSMVVCQGERTWTFALDEEARTMLLEGLDMIQLTLKSSDDIAQFRGRDAERRPWVYFQ